MFSKITSIFSIGGKIISSKDLYNSQLIIVRRDGSQSESSVAGHDFEKGGFGDVLTVYFYTGKVIRWDPESGHWEEGHASQRGRRLETIWRPVYLHISITEFDDDYGTENERLLSFALSA